ncbi:MAG: lipid II flippase MurJ [Patescibacteria group bacterium]
MIKKVFNLLHQDISGLHKAAYVLGLSALLSQSLALLRDRLFAHSFGAGEILDIYYASFRIPDFIFISVASIVSLSVLIPFLTQQKDKEYSKRFMSEIFSVFFVLIAVVSLLMFFLMPVLVPFIFRGFSPDALQQVISLSRIMLLSPILLGFSNCLTSIIQVNKKFFIYAISPLLYNVGIIVGIILFYPMFGIKGLAFGVALGAFLHLFIQLPSIYRLGFIPKLILIKKFNKIKKIILLSLPRTLALSSGNLAILALVAFASTMGEGAISVFNFAFTIQSIPLGIIGVSYSVAAFPILSELSRDKKEEFLEQITVVARYIVFWTTTALIFFIVLRAQIVRTVLGSGKFDWTDTRLTAACLAIFAFSITAQSLVLFFVKGYYAAGITKRPVIINIFSSACIVAFVFLFKFCFAAIPFLRESIGYIFKVGDIANIDILILPLSYSLGTILNACLLYYLFKKDFNYSSKELEKSYFQTFIASIIMGVCAYFSLELWNNVFDINTLIGIFLQGLLSGLTGIIVLIIILKWMGNKEINEIFANLKMKFFNGSSC